jgi:putative transposase
VKFHRPNETNELQPPATPRPPLQPPRWITREQSGPKTADDSRVANWAVDQANASAIAELDQIVAAFFSPSQLLVAELLRRPIESTQYTSIAFGLRCGERGVRPSMGSVGDAYDNAMCESFFATLECELLDRTRFKNQLEARLAVFDFIEGWYNPHRRHSSIEYFSPINYERRQIAS